MADNNVVSPNPNASTLATGSDLPQSSSAVQSLLAGLNQPTQPAPVYQPPVQQNTSRWAGLVQGALLGLAGGLKAGMQNVQDAGTPRGPHANGFAEGEAEEQNFQAQQQQQAAQRNQQAQQQFQDQLESRRFSQEEMLNRARQMEANLNAYKLAKEIDGAPEEAQQKYLQGQQALAKSYADDEHLTPIADVVGTQGLLQWMKQTGKNSADFKTTHTRDDQGHDIITVWPRHDAQLDSNTINSQLKAIGSDRTVPTGTTMAAHDAHALLMQEGGKVADNLRKQADEAQREKFEHGENVYKESQENARHAQDQQVTSQSVPELGEAIAKGLLTEDQIPGFAKLKPQVQAYLAKQHPDLDQSSVQLDGQERRLRDLSRNAEHNLQIIGQVISRRPDLLGVVQGRLTRGEQLIGTDDPDLGTLATAIDNYGLAATGAHSVRAEAARKDAKEALLNGFKNGPQAAQAAIESAHGSLDQFANLGRPRRVDGSLYNQPPAQSNKPNLPQHKVGDKVTYNGKSYTVSGVRPDGKLELR